MFVDEPGFLTLLLVSFLEGTLFCGWHIFLVPNGIALGFNVTRSSFLASFTGFGSMFGRLLSGFLIDHGLLQAHHVFAGSSFLLALVCLLDPIAAPSYEAVAALATLGGLCLGVIFPLTIVLSVRFPEEKRVSALSWMLVFFGTGMSAGSFLFGEYYKNISNTWHISLSHRSWMRPVGPNDKHFLKLWALGGGSRLTW